METRCKHRGSSPRNRALGNCSRRAFTKLGAWCLSNLGAVLTVQVYVFLKIRCSTSSAQIERQVAGPELLPNDQVNNKVNKKAGVE